MRNDESQDIVIWFTIRYLIKPTYGGSLLFHPLFTHFQVLQVLLALYDNTRMSTQHTRLDQIHRK